MAAEWCPCPRSRPGFCNVKYVVFGTVNHILPIFIVFSLPGKRFLLFIVFLLPGNKFCRYLSCSRSLERDFVAIYRVPAPWRKILSLFIVFPLPGERFWCCLSCSRSFGSHPAKLGKQILSLFIVFPIILMISG